MSGRPLCNECNYTECVCVNKEDLERSKGNRTICPKCIFMSADDECTCRVSCIKQDNARLRTEKQNLKGYIDALEKELKEAKQYFQGPLGYPTYKELKKRYENCQDMLRAAHDNEARLKEELKAAYSEGYGNKNMRPGPIIKMSSEAGSYHQHTYRFKHILYAYLGGSVLTGIMAIAVVLANNS